MIRAENSGRYSAMPDPIILMRATLTLLAAIAAGWLLDSSGLPLGWLVGAMLAMITASLLRLPAVQPTRVLPYVKGAVGTMLGASIPTGLAQSVADWWPSLLCMFAVMLAGGVLNYKTLRRGFGFRRMDAALCAMPGGISEMILLGEQAGADQRRVAIVHALRIALSILIIPILAGLVFGITVGSSGDLPPVHMSVPDWIWFAFCVLSGVAAERWTRLPIPLILVPLFVSAALHLTGITAFHVPPAIAIAIQVMIGINVGARFLGISPHALAHVALAACTVAGIQMALAVGAAAVLALTGHRDALALMLAYAPGGLAEMSLIAVTMGREVAFVVFHHILRVLFALFVAPPLLLRLGRIPHDPASPA